MKLHWNWQEFVRRLYSSMVGLGAAAGFIAVISLSTERTWWQSLTLTAGAMVCIVGSITYPIWSTKRESTSQKVER